MFSNAFTPFQNCSLWAVAFATHGKSVRRGSAPPFSSHVRWGEPGFPVTPLRDTTACAPFSKERRMKLAEATNLDRKSGEHRAPLHTVDRGGYANLQQAIFVVFVVLFKSVLHPAHQRFGIEFGPDDLVGAVALDSHPVIAHERDLLPRDDLLDL